VFIYGLAGSADSGFSCVIASQEKLAVAMLLASGLGVTRNFN
jgi:hypothetical protein